MLFAEGNILRFFSNYIAKTKPKNHQLEISTSNNLLSIKVKIKTILNLCQKTKNQEVCFILVPLVLELSLKPFSTQSFIQIMAQEIIMKFIVNEIILKNMEVNLYIICF